MKRRSRSEKDAEEEEMQEMINLMQLNKELS